HGRAILPLELRDGTGHVFVEPREPRHGSGLTTPALPAPPVRCPLRGARRSEPVIDCRQMTASAAKEPGTSFRRKMIFLAVVLVLGLAYVLRGILVPLFLAFLLAYALDPFVDRLEALRVPRPLGAILVMLGIAGLVG